MVMNTHLFRDAVITSKNDVSKPGFCWETVEKPKISDFETCKCLIL